MIGHACRSRSLGRRPRKSELTFAAKLVCHLRHGLLALERTML